MILGKIVSLWGTFVQIKLGSNFQRFYTNRWSLACGINKPLVYTLKEAFIPRNSYRR